MPAAEKVQQEDRYQRRVITADLAHRELAIRIVSSGSRTGHTDYRYEIRNPHQGAEGVQDQKNSTVGETRSGCTEGTVAHRIPWHSSLTACRVSKKMEKLT
jgi:hypothetical protein